MKIIVISMKIESNKKSVAQSVLEDYFDKPLKQLGHQIYTYDFMGRLQIVGKKSMNDELKKLIEEINPDYALFVPYQNEFFPETISHINLYTTTIGYFFDDTWRIEYSKFWSKFYHYVTTSSVNGKSIWNIRGCANFIYSPFGCNHDVFKNKNVEKIYDVTFVGGYHTYRAWVIRKLKKSGISVNVWGNGWPNGELTQEQMVNVFNQSKINLNLSNNDSFDIRFILNLSRPILESLRVLKKTFTSFFKKDVKVLEMVKARHFEINACGSFQLTFYVEGLEEHFHIGKQIAIYQSIEDMVEKIKYFLNNENEREEIANNALLRSLKDHSLELRFKKLFDDINLIKNT